MPMRKRPALGSDVVVRAAVLGLTAVAAVVTPAFAQTMPDMVSRTAFRVCADSSNMPFSNRKGEGFENKIAAIVADELKLPLRYFWAPSGPGFIRNTLQSDLCDVVIGYAAGAEIVQHTNPYYRSTYVLVAPKGSPLADVTSLDDPKLKGRHIGVFAATPPVDLLVARGLMADAKVYALIVDHRFESPLGDLIADLKSKTIDAAVVWGPLVGLDVKKAGDLVMTPLLKQGNEPDYSYRITFGIRHDEPDWKHKLEGVIRARQQDINKVLEDYNVPLLDNAGKPIVVAPAAADAKPPTP
jgi:mxaJ protein